MQKDKSFKKNYIIYTNPFQLIKKPDEGLLHRALSFSEKSQLRIYRIGLTGMPFNLTS